MGEAGPQCGQKDTEMLLIALPQTQTKMQLALSNPPQDKAKSV
jgi:hypothetical protein